ncbi:FTR1 family protein [Candidatus Woesearchaeota archaeon]|nr:FTR1 family protein [Candidatus Woesearchaeota archaeon]
MESFLITSRETLEASLVVGIVLAYLDRTNNGRFRKWVYYGIAFGILASMLSAYLFSTVAGGFEGRAENIFEGVTMVVGAFLLTTMIFWMAKQHRIALEIEGDVEKMLSSESMAFSYISIFFLVFVAVLREGAETVIFLNAANYTSGVSLIGGILGVIFAVIVGILLFVGVKKINLSGLFRVSSVLLIFFAAGLVAHGIHEFEEAGIVSGIITPVFDINPEANADGSFPALHENGVVGGFLKGLFGYNGNPSLLELISYLAYLAIVLLLTQTFKK